MRVCIAGGGLAGTLLAWRLAGRPEVESVDLLLGDHTASDATEVSGGVVRAYEPHPEQRRLAVDSLTELLASPVLREWSRFRETGSLYLRSHDPGLATALRQIDAELPGSARLLGTEALADLGWAGLPYGTVAVSERVAGAISPSALRSAVLRELTMCSAVNVSSASLDSVLPRIDGTVTGFVGGRRRDYDVAVVAAGAWTPRWLVTNALSPAGYRTKSIQYTVYAVGGGRPGPFVDETTGLYGAPTADGGTLLGLATTEWDVVPGLRPPTAQIHAAAARLARTRLPHLSLGPATATVNATDCYCDPPVLALRPVPGTSGAVWTFTGGSGGSAKTALAASRRGADRLVQSKYGLTNLDRPFTTRSVIQP